MVTIRQRCEFTRAERDRRACTRRTKSSARTGIVSRSVEIRQNRGFPIALSAFDSNNQGEGNRGPEQRTEMALRSFRSPSRSTRPPGGQVCVRHAHGHQSAELGQAERLPLCGFGAGHRARAISRQSLLVIARRRGTRLGESTGFDLSGNVYAPPHLFLGGLRDGKGH